ncbi:hypothetical protein CTI12_AA081520 [Artemisia annua]|uniref:Uncharacterized protein n=1 Tax=Artemisia annua TaxID=35608 RepID=A0A2U1Q2K7_ARTAN|nr:hypothetical protein CTI12_AA081520 [Artemisia annua]
MDPKLALIKSARRGNCNYTKDVIGRHVNAPIGISIHEFSCPNTRNNVAPKATIIVVVEMNNMTRPIINLRGNSNRKFCSAKRVVRMDKNINRDVTDVNNDTASDNANITKAGLLVKMDIPDS